MRTAVRSIALMALTASFVAGCGAATPAATATATPAATPAAPTATPAPPDPTATPAPTPTAVPSVGPMDAAYVTGTGGTLSQTNPGTTTPDGACTRIDGVVVETAAGTNADPRVAGATRVTISALDCGGVGFQWGTMSQKTADGAWEGTCTGAFWADESESSLSCWLVGSGAYKGLTYNMHSRNVGFSVEVDGVILPAPPPTTR